MRLIIGGYAQGKLLYATHQYPGAQVVEIKSEDSVKEALEQWEKMNQFSGQMIFYGLHRFTKILLQEKEASEVKQMIEKMAEKNPEIIWISDEIGNGIVPMEKFDRIYREETGRILCMLAEKSDSVERIVCGIAQKIK